jgi:DNA polymerase
VTLAFIDFETYSCTDLKKSGAYRYVEDPTFEVLMLAISLDGGPVESYVGEQRILEVLRPLLARDDVRFVAHNANFERIVMSALLGMPVGTYLHPRKFICTAVLAAEYSLPRSLDKLGETLGGARKDSAGTRLINLFSKPYRRKRVLPEDRPEEWLEFIAYCVQDVYTLIDVFRRLPKKWPTDVERPLWEANELLNDRGVKIDVAMVAAAVFAGDELKARLMAESKEITGLANPNSTQQLHGWLAERGAPLENLQKETVETALELNDEMPDDVRRVLEIRLETSLASLKKFEAALRGVNDDDRLRGHIRFFAAHTGRFGGTGVQTQNLTREILAAVKAYFLDCKEREVEPLQSDIDKVVQGEVDRLIAGEGEITSEFLKGLIRPMFVGPFTGVDFSAIEARVIAWLAHEKWVLDAFAEGRDIYVETANRLGEGYTRQQGKVAVLALGFGGGEGALLRMGAEGTSEELQIIKRLWRTTNPAIVRFWRACELGFKQGGKAGRITFRKFGKDMHAILPSGRALIYRDVRVFHDPIEGERLTYMDPKGYRADTWGGSIAENVTQAVARDVLAESMVRMTERGYPIVLHVHDEIVLDGLYDVNDVADQMCEMEPWMAGLPLAAEGSQMNRYQKG